MENIDYFFWVKINFFYGYFNTLLMWEIVSRNAPPFPPFLLYAYRSPGPQAQREMIDNCYRFSEHLPLVVRSPNQNILRGQWLCTWPKFSKKKRVFFHGFETKTGILTQYFLLETVSWFHACAWKIHSDPRESRIAVFHFRPGGLSHAVGK